jgi:hypothetical protein
MKMRTRRLALESLEARTLMAGNVTVAVTDGVLHVQGDAADNDLQIRAVPQHFTGPWPGAKYLLTGVSHYDNTTPTTTINGQTSLVVEGVKNGADIRLGAGSNSLRIANPTSDPNKFQPTVVPGAVTINTGADHDIIRLYVENHNTVIVNGGLGADVIDVVNSTFRNFGINSDPVPPSGGSAGANDNVLVFGVHVTGSARFYTGFDDGQLHGSDHLRINGANRFDGMLTIEARYASVIFDPQASRLTVGGSANIAAQSLSMNKADIGSVSGGSLIITGNNLHNDILLRDVTIAGRLNVSLLGSNDQLWLERTSAHDGAGDLDTILNGGDGSDDIYVDGGGNNLGRTSMSGFEESTTP